MNILKKSGIIAAMFILTGMNVEAASPEVVVTMSDVIKITGVGNSVAGLELELKLEEGTFSSSAFKSSNTGAYTFEKVSDNTITIYSTGKEDLSSNGEIVLGTINTSSEAIFTDNSTLKIVDFTLYETAYTKVAVKDEGISGGNNSGGNNSGGDNSGGDSSGGDNSGGDNSGGDNSGGDSSGGDNSGGNNSGGSTSGGSTSGGSTSGGSTSNGSTSNGSTSNGTTSTDDEDTEDSDDETLLPSDSLTNNNEGVLSTPGSESTTTNGSEITSDTTSNNVMPVVLVLLGGALCVAAGVVAYKKKNKTKN